MTTAPWPFTYALGRNTGGSQSRMAKDTRPCSRPKNLWLSLQAMGGTMAADIIHENHDKSAKFTVFFTFDKLKC